MGAEVPGGCKEPCNDGTPGCGGKEEASMYLTHHCVRNEKDQADVDAYAARESSALSSP